MKKFFQKKMITLAGLIPILLLSLNSCLENKSKENIGWQGYLEGEFVYISAPVSGKLKSLHVKRGEQVKAEQSLFNLDSVASEKDLGALEMFHKALAYCLEDMRKGKRLEETNSLEALVKADKALVEGSATGYARASEMYRKKAMSFKEYNIIKHLHLFFQAWMSKDEAILAKAKLGERPDRIAALRAGLDSIKQLIGKYRWNLDQTQQKAPDSALVFDTYYKRGEFVAAGSPVVSLLSPENIKVRFFVGEKDLAGISIGKKVGFRVDGKNDLSATVNYISTQAEYTPPVIYSENCRHKLVYMVEAMISPEVAVKLHPGQPVTVK